MNTTKQSKSISVTYELNGKVSSLVINLKAGEMFSEASAKTIIDRKVKVISVETTDAAGKIKEVVPGRIASANEILKQSAVLDIETTNLRPGSPITQIAVTSLGDKKSTLFVPSKQNFIATVNSLEDGISFQQRLKAKAIDIPPGYNFRDIKFAQTYMEKNQIKLTDIVREGEARINNVNFTFKEILEAGRAERKDLEDFMIRTDRFQAKLFVEDEAKLVEAGMQRNPTKVAFMKSLIDGELTETQLRNYLIANQGVLDIDKEISSLSLIKDRSLRDIVNADLPELLKGKITWIANANFESAQFGAQIRAEAFDSMKALNAAREAAGESQLDEKTFMRMFNQGALEKELTALNAKRGADKQLYTKNPFQPVTAINLTTGKPFDVVGTGAYDLARAQAMKTGDFSNLYEALLADTRPGDVRDITDLSRALQSKLKKIGVLDIERPTALSVEVQARLALAAREMRLAEEAGESIDLERLKKGLFSKETHIAIGDTVLSESPLLRESFDMLEALRKVEAGGAEADALMRQASEGKGAYFRALTIGGLQEYFNKPAISAAGETLEGLDDVLFRQFAGRSLVDLYEKGSTEFREDKPGYGKKTVSRLREGVAMNQSVNTSSFVYKNYHNIDEILTKLGEIKEYGSANKQAYIEKIKSETKDFFDSNGNLIESKREQFYNYAKPLKESADRQIKAIEQRFAGIDAEFFESVKTFNGMNLRQRNLKPIVLEGVTTGTPKSAAEAMTQKAAVFSDVAETTLRKALGRGLAGAALLGIGFKVVDEVSNNREKQSNYVLPDFDQFMEAQSKFYGSKESFLAEIRKKYNIEGLQETGIMSEMRSVFTDFGSPYQGMGYSMSVLDNDKLRRERQKFEQAQFGSRHFSEQGDVGFQLKRFVDSVFRKQMGYSKPGASMIFGDFQTIEAGKYNSLKGDNLIEYKVSADQISVQDADTITIRRNGAPRNALSNFMGTGKQESMAVRLAGIDAPETAHGDRSAQPYAEMAKQIATELISKAKDIRIVSTPDDTTYGRQVSMVYVDGKNLNLELVRRGAAAFLPYRGKGKSLFYNQKAFEQAQTFAQEGNRGMWSNPYFRAYEMISKGSGQTVTFNTLVNASKVAKSEHLMSTASLMEAAQAAGGINEQLRNEILGIAEQQKMASRSSKRSIYSGDSLRNRWMNSDLSTFGYNPNSINSILDQVKSEVSLLQKTKGSKATAETAKTRRVSKNNLSLANETLKNASKEYNFEKSQRIQKIQEMKIRKAKRIQDMEVMQQGALRNLFNSPINHQRM